jgi:hypothetical protein
MKDEYDFSRGHRGKYFHEGAAIVPPVRLDSDVLSYLSALAAARQESLDALVNRLLKKDIELIEAAK